MHGTRVLLAGAILIASLSTVWAEDAKRTFVFPVVESAGKPATAECVVSCAPAAPVTAVAFSPDGKHLFVGGYGEVLDWDLAAAKLARRIGAGVIAGRVGAMVFLKDGRLAVGDGVPGRSGAVRIFDVASGAQVIPLTGPADAVGCLAVSPDGSLLAAGGAFQKVCIYSLKELRLVQTLEGFEDWVRGLAFAPEGTLLAAAGADRSLTLFKTDTWERAGRGAAPEPLYGVAFNPDGKTVVVACGGPTEATLRTFQRENTRNGAPAGLEGGTPTSLEWSAKTGRMYVASTDGAARAVSGGRTLATYRGHADCAYAATVNPDGNRVATGGADGTVRVFDASDGRLIASFIQLAPKSDRWAIVAGDGRVSASGADAVTIRAAGGVKLADGIEKLVMNPDAVRKALEPPAPVPPPTPKKTGK